MQRKLETEQEARQKLVMEIDTLKNVNKKQHNFDSIGVVEKLTQVINLFTSIIYQIKIA